MKKASTRLLEQETQTPSTAPDLIPAESSTENLHWDWYSKRGHFSSVERFVGRIFTKDHSRPKINKRGHVIIRVPLNPHDHYISPRNISFHSRFEKMSVDVERSRY